MIIKGTSSFTSNTLLIRNSIETDRIVRPKTTKKWKDYAKTKAASESIGIDCAKLWNSAPLEIKNANTLYGAKIEIKKFCRLIEI